MSDELERLALGCLLAAFDGTSVPGWARRRVADGLGGIVLFARNIESPEQVAGLTAALRDARDEILIATDEEGGDVTRLEAKTGSSYPGNLALGQVDDVALTQRVAAAIGRDLAATGINVDFAPVADVNTNPDNPIIGVRSFGDRPGLVAAHVAAFVSGLQGEGVAACAKHFPGHGDTTVDSHRALPRVDQSRAELETVALIPFRSAIQAGVAAIMTGHLLVPAYDAVPATLSRRILTELLRGEMGFSGLIVTDALEMRAISSTVGMGEAAVLALAAGADAICIGARVDERLVDEITAAIVMGVRTGRLTRQRLEDAVERVRKTATRFPSTITRPSAGPDDLGSAAARRAIHVEGDIHVEQSPVVIELQAEPSAAVGAVPWGIGDLVAAALPGTTVIRRDVEEPDLVNALEMARERPMIIVGRDLDRNARTRSFIDEASARQRNVVVVEMGLARRVPARAVGYIATYGSSRVNAIAAVERLLAGYPAAGPATEHTHGETARRDRLDTAALLNLMHREDRHAVEQVGQCLDLIGRAVEAIAGRIGQGGRLHYFGAGTSGRLAALDALECPGTFGVSPDVVIAHVAPTDADEDDPALGEADARAGDVAASDAVVGVSASGETAYVRAAIAAAHAKGALTVAVTCAPGSALGRESDIAIDVPTGPELIAGSTRLKAGTAQKIVLNMLSTGVFSRLGHVYRGRMVDVVPSNEKLRRRAAQIVRDITAVGPTEAERALAAADGNAKLAILMLETGLSVDAARARLREGHGDLSVALGESE